MRSRVFVLAVLTAFAGCSAPGPSSPVRNDLPRPLSTAPIAPAEHHSTNPTATGDANTQGGSTDSGSGSSAPGLRTVSINVSGDLLWHDTLWASARSDAGRTGRGDMDFAPQLASLATFVQRADIAVCHAEVPFAPEGGPYQGYPLFAAPPVIATTIKELGWDLCTTASNHAMDQDWEGLVRTIDVHEAAGVRTVGTYRTAQEAQTPVIVETEQGVKVGFVSQTFGLNGLPKAAGKDWSVDLLDADKAIADAQRAKAAGADIVVVHLHAGEEYQHRPNDDQVSFAEQVTQSEAVDLVVGQHAHVVQPIDRVHEKWVIYGSGNLIAQSGPARPYSFDGLMAEVTFAELPDGSFRASALEWAPTMITMHKSNSPARTYLIPEALAAGVGPTEQLRQSAQRTRTIVTSAQVTDMVEMGLQS